MTSTEPPVVNGRLEDLLERSALLHDHVCPRQVLGVRMGMYAGEILGLDLPQRDKRLLTVVEIDGCFVDGVAVATGCTLGHRTMRCVDEGKIAATFIDSVTGDGVRIHPSTESRRLAARYAAAAVDRWHAYLEGYRKMPIQQLMVAEAARLTSPVETLVSSPEYRACCDDCGEEIFNEREIVVAERVLCRGCAGQRYVEILTSERARASGAR